MHCDTLKLKVVLDAEKIKQEQEAQERALAAEENRYRNSIRVQEMEGLHQKLASFGIPSSVCVKRGRVQSTYCGIVYQVVPCALHSWALLATAEYTRKRFLHKPVTIKLTRRISRLADLQPLIDLMEKGSTKYSSEGYCCDSNGY